MATAATAMQTISADCASATAALASQNFGEFSDNGSCSYDCGFKEQTWWWKWDGTTWVKDQTLGPGITGANLATPWPNAISKTVSWAQTNLPRYGAVVTADLQGASDAQLADAVTQVASSLAEANTALQNLASWLSWVQPQAPNFPALCTSLNTQADTSLQNLAMNLMGQVSCGEDDIQNSINGNAKAPVAQSFANMTSSLATVQADFTTALNAASGVAGVFLNIQSMSDLVTGQISVAQGYPAGSALRMLHADEAAADWNTLLTYVQAQLGS
jgi:hypothetical protein